MPCIYGCSCFVNLKLLAEHMCEFDTDAWSAHGDRSEKLACEPDFEFFACPKKCTPTPVVLFHLILHCAHCQGTAVPSSHDQSTTSEPLKQSALPAEGCGQPEKHLQVERVQWRIPPALTRLRAQGTCLGSHHRTATGAAANQRTCIFYIWL